MIELRYGFSSQTAILPQDWQVQKLRVPSAEGGQSGVSLLLHALENPIDTSSLETFLRVEDSVVLLVPDKTRLCYLDLMLPLVLGKIHSAGIERGRITILVASGTHARMSEVEMIALLGEDIFHSYRIVQHQAKEEDQCVYVGRTCFGTDISLNRIVTTADKVIVIGTIVHHYFAGYGGGAKMFVPGVASYSTAVQNHRRTLDTDGTFLDACRDGNLEGNEVILDIYDAMRFFPPTFYFASILDGDGKVAASVAGDLAAAHQVGCRIVDEMYLRPISSKADVTLVSAGGWPRDINFIQAHKALHRAHYATKDGGVIICVTECAEGIGNDSFLSWFQYTSDEEMKRMVLNHYSMNGHTAIALRKKTRQHKIIFVSSLPDDTVQLLGMIPMHSLEQALNRAVTLLSKYTQSFILENGSLLVPIVQSKTESSTRL